MRNKKEFTEDAVFVENLKACEEWPDHAYMMRPHGLKDALFLLHDIFKTGEIPPEAELRKACALVYADHLRLEGKHFYAQEAQRKTTAKWKRAILRREGGYWIVLRESEGK